jgi:imidazole glycerol phosphate synthase subunit HisF
MARGKTWCCGVSGKASSEERLRWWWEERVYVQGLGEVLMEAFMEFGHRDGRESDGGSP